MNMKKSIVIIEDGDEYRAFAELFLSRYYRIMAFSSVYLALRALEKDDVYGFILDLRFDRASPDELTGDVDATAARLFSGDRGKALDYIKANQGTLILAELRRAGYKQRALFVHDFPAGRLQNLKRLYGDVVAVPSFDAARILTALSTASK